MVKSISRHSTTSESGIRILKRKNFLPTLLITIVFWLLFAGLIYFTDPFSPGTIPAFFILFFLCLLFTFSLLFANTRRGILISFTLTLFLILRYLGIGHLLNFILLAGLAITIELYFSRR